MIIELNTSYNYSESVILEIDLFSVKNAHIIFYWHLCWKQITYSNNYNLIS